MKIYVTGLIAYETSLRLYEENKAAVAARFPKFFLREFEKLSEDQADMTDFLDNLCIEKNTKKPYSRKNYYFDGSAYIREIRDGGIFAALWAMCEDLKTMKQDIGCEIDLEAIPIDQHIVEILELLKENPYEVSSGGSYLVALSEEMEAEEGLTEIGMVTDSKDRVIVSGENRRFLTPPSRQAKDIADRRGEH